jgi:hypothetical protein
LVPERAHYHGVGLGEARRGARGDGRGLTKTWPPARRRRSSPIPCPASNRMCATSTAISSPPWRRGGAFGHAQADDARHGADGGHVPLRRAKRGCAHKAITVHCMWVQRQRPWGLPSPTAVGLPPKSPKPCA